MPEPKIDEIAVGQWFFVPPDAAIPAVMHNHVLKKVSDTRAMTANGRPVLWVKDWPVAW